MVAILPELRAQQLGDLLARHGRELDPHLLQSDQVIHTEQIGAPKQELCECDVDTAELFQRLAEFRATARSVSGRRNCDGPPETSGAQAKALKDLGGMECRVRGWMPGQGAALPCFHHAGITSRKSIMSHLQIAAERSYATRELCIRHHRSDLSLMPLFVRAQDAEDLQDVVGPE